MADVNPTKSASATLDSAISDSAVPKFYFNGFMAAGTHGDGIVVLTTNGRPTAVLNMSFTVAKSLGVALGQMIADLETASGRPIMTTADVEQLMSTKGNSIQ